MRVGSAACLHGCNLLWILDVGNVEDSYAAEAVFLRDRNVVLFFFGFVLIVFILVFVIVIFTFVLIAGGIFVFILIFVRGRAGSGGNP